MKFHFAQIASFNFQVEADTEAEALKKAVKILGNVPKNIPAALPLEFVDLVAEIAIVDEPETLEIFDVRES